MMSEFVCHISVEAEGALARLVGNSISPRAEQARLGGGSIVLDGIKFLFADDDCIALGQEWFETPLCAIDYFELTAESEVLSKQDRQTIPVSLDGLSSRNVDQIHVVECWRDDEIVEGEHKGETEMVRFDGALVFEMEDGSGFKLGIVDSIAGSLTYQHYSCPALQSSLREWRVRKVITESTIN